MRQKHSRKNKKGHDDSGNEKDGRRRNTCYINKLTQEERAEMECEKDTRERDEFAKWLNQSVKEEEKALEMRLATKDEKILEGRKKLPVYPYREVFLAALQEHQVLILVGDTGSGKTTQSKYLLS